MTDSQRPRTEAALDVPPQPSPEEERDAVASPETPEAASIPDTKGIIEALSREEAEPRKRRIKKGLDTPESLPRQGNSLWRGKEATEGKSLWRGKRQSVTDSQRPRTEPGR